ncbi:MAG: SIS domain-containing protein [Phycisphaerales bacterium]|nr:SIS domain-containing protein [Planctomycetota bacterium]MCH8509527.1 SIS domain-containing protein [Phycisphaerales bacterium]
MPTKAPRTGGTDAPADPNCLDEQAFIARVLRHEAEAVAALAESADDRYARAVDLIVACADAGGSVLVSGLGKSGLIGSKISATLASLGITSHAVHPTEAVHGDLGRFRPSDVAVCLSQSGETEEVVALASILRQDAIPVIAITRGCNNADRHPSSLERIATVTLPTLVGDEAGDGDFMAPTSSTTAALAIGDALALAAARRRAFTEADFRRRHPGGQLGGLLRPVTDLIRFQAGVNLPLVDEGMTVQDALQAAAKVVRRPGALLVTGQGGALAGIFTDSDLRRLILRDTAELTRPISAVMTRAPRALPDSALARDAVAMFREHRQDEIPIIDDAGRPVGLLDVQDLIAMRLVREDD